MTPAMSDPVEAPLWWESDYFRGYRSHKPHPMMTSTGSEGRCDICGRSQTRDHEPPFERITYQEHLDERLAEFATTSDKPIRPMFAWERSEPLGEGRAGNYLAHLRESPPTFKPNSFFKQAAAAARMEAEELMKLPKDARFALIYGSAEPVDTPPWWTGANPSQIKEVPMPKYALTVEATDLLALSKAIEAIDRTVTGACVEKADLLGPESFEFSIESTYGETQQERVHVEEKRAIHEYLTKVCAAQERGDISVEIDYEAEGTGERTTRKAIPFRIEQRSQSSWPYSRRDYLVLQDVEKAAMRSFLVQNIISVDGPVL